MTAGNEDMRTTYVMTAIIKVPATYDSTDSSKARNFNSPTSYRSQRSSPTRTSSFGINSRSSVLYDTHRRSIVHIAVDTYLPPTIKMKIEWASHFNADGTPRRPPASTMHGWLAKMRGTITGDEDLRSRGMREMKEARAKSKRKAGGGRQHSSRSTGKSLFSFLGFGKKTARAKSTSSSSGRRNESKKLQPRSSTRPTASRQSTTRSGGGAQGGSSRPPTSRRSTGHRSQRPTPTPKPSYASGRHRSDRKH